MTPHTRISPSPPITRSPWVSMRMAVMLLYGFSSGLPLLAIGSTLQAWMMDEGVVLATIGLYSLVGLPYSIKFLWAPLFDRFSLGTMGRRRGWVLISQVVLCLLFLSLSQLRPSADPWLLGLVALALSFASASQDIVLDAYRREILPHRELGLGASIFVCGYRLGMLLAGAGAVGLSAYGLEWSTVYLLLAIATLVGVVTTLFAPEPTTELPPPRTLREAVVEPLREFFSRPGAAAVLGFILLYKLGDSMASTMTTPFILSEGYTKGELAGVVKTFGLAATLGGGVLGGALLLRLTLSRALLVFGVLQALSTAFFVVLLMVPHTWYALATVVAFENVSSGLGTAAYAAFMAALCDRRFTATQYALLSGLMSVPRVILGTPTGYLATAIGWGPFFLGCAVIALPGLLLIGTLRKRQAGSDLQS